MCRSLVCGYDELNRLETVRSTKGNDDSYDYDFRGDRKTNYEVSDLLIEENVSYSYDELNRLYYVNKDSISTQMDYTADGYRFVKKVGGQNTFYVYDVQGRLNAEVKVVSQTVNGVTKTFLYPVASYIWGPDRVLEKLDSISNTSYYYIYNWQGDVIQILDTTGNVVNSYDYDVWGNFIIKSETIHNPFTYFCQTYDESTGLYYLRARYYDPKTGRFTQEDPIRSGYNWYVYGNSNPEMFVDPSGMADRYVNGSDVRLRSAAGTSSTTYDLLPKGALVDWTGQKTEMIDGHMWAQVKWNGITGWVAADYLGVAPVGSKVVPAPEIQMSSYSYEPTTLQEAMDLYVSSGQAEEVMMSAAFITGGVKFDIKQINQVAKTLGMNDVTRRAFGDYIESLKDIVPNNKNFSWKELIDIGKEFLGK